MLAPTARPWTAAQHTALVALCRQYHVARLWLFGSALTPRFDPARSDFDFVVELFDVLEADGFRPDMLLLGVELEAVFGRSVDLLTSWPIRNPYLRAEVEKTRTLIYDATREKVFS
ncbi:MAG: nucleotidyltransferase domain-containing protein [Hymenobacteraceae bacterium]|nr:nucleotidyltransferase domain-containing protein [Hymenobacteraceae bacterium]